MDENQQIILRLQAAYVPKGVYRTSLFAEGEKELETIIVNKKFVGETREGGRKGWVPLQDYWLVGPTCRTIVSLMCKELTLIGQKARVIPVRGISSLREDEIGEGYFIIPGIDVGDTGADWRLVAEVLWRHGAAGGGFIIGSITGDLPPEFISGLSEEWRSVERIELKDRRTPTNDRRRVDRRAPR